tara:strand:+ start:229 stop:1350 length:1122 start_codon:yes stop_codon:yes gene_type:complete
MDRYTLAHSSGADWKSTAEQCLAEIKRPEQRTGYAQIGLLYLTDNIAADTEDILAFLREQTGVRDWVGSVGMGICATGQEYFDEPAIAILITEVEENSYRLLEGTKNLKPLSEEISVWSSQQESCFAIVHADPRNGAIPDIISGLADQLNGFLVGGLTSSRGPLSQISGEVCDGGVSGLVLAGNVPVSTALSQSCMPIGLRHQITACNQNVLIELDGRPALDVFKEDIGELLARDLQRIEGYIFAALPIANSDTGDYLVRNLVGIDLEQKMLAIGEIVESGQSIQFCRRDAEAAEADLVRMLDDLKRRTDLTPKGAVYFTCLARGPNMFGNTSQELKIIERELGDVPLVGFFCNGEISHRRLYTYTGVLTLFT